MTPSVAIGCPVGAAVASASATGSLIVKSVPRPTALSTRIFPPWASIISRHAARPRPAAPLAGRVGSRLGRVSALEDPRQQFQRDAASRVPDRQLNGPVLRVVGRADDHLPAAGHRLPRVGQQVHEHLLDLVAHDHRGGGRGVPPLDADTVLLQLPLEQHEGLVGQAARSVGAGSAERFRASPSTLEVSFSARCPAARIFSSALVRGGLVCVPEPEFRRS